MVAKKAIELALIRLRLLIVSLESLRKQLTFRLSGANACQYSMSCEFFLEPMALNLPDTKNNYKRIAFISVFFVQI